MKSIITALDRVTDIRPDRTSGSSLSIQSITDALGDDKALDVISGKSLPEVSGTVMGKAIASVLRQVEKLEGLEQILNARKELKHQKASAAKSSVAEQLVKPMHGKGMH